MKKSLTLFAAIAALTGCQTTETTTVPPKPAAVTAAKPIDHATYAELTPAARQAAIAAELRAIGAAIKAYQAKNGGKWPAALTDLIKDGLLPASALVSASDPTEGQEGGVPDSYDQWQQSTEADEANCSFLYEFSGATATWGWQTYLAANPSVDALDTDKSGAVSWLEAKQWQLAHGDTAQDTPAAYAKNRFPVVRCYWYGYPDSKDDTSIRSVISLAADLETVILSQPWWEKDSAPVILP